MDDVTIYALAKGQADAAAASAKAAQASVNELATAAGYTFGVDETGKLAFYRLATTTQEG